MPQLRNFWLAALCAVTGGCTIADGVGPSLTHQVLGAQANSKVACAGTGCGGPTKATTAGINGTSSKPTLTSERELAIEEPPTAVEIFDINSLPCLAKPCTVKSRFDSFNLLLNNANVESWIDSSDGQTHEIHTSPTLFNRSLQYVDSKCRVSTEDTTACPPNERHSPVGATGNPADPLPSSRSQHCVMERKFHVVSSEFRVRISGFNDPRRFPSSDLRKYVYVLLYVRQVCDGRPEVVRHDRSIADHLKVLGIRLAS